jgi:ATP-binding cassette subfamily B protein
MTISPKIPVERAASLRRILKLARPEAKWIGLGIFFLAVGSLMSLLFPQAIRIMIDHALAPGGEGLRLVDWAAAALVVIFLVQAVATSLRYALFTIVGERVVTRLRADLFATLLDQEIAFFDERRTGELVSRLASDTSVLQNAVSINISMALRYLASIIGGVGALVYTSPRLTVVMLSVVPPVALGAVAYGRRIRKLSREVQDAIARSNEVAEEALGGIRTVRAFAAEKTEGGRYSGAVQGSFDLARRRVVLGSIFMGVATFAAFGSAALVLWYGGRLVVRDALSVGELTSFLVYTLIVAFSLGGLSDLWAELMKAVGAAERVFELLDRKPSMPREGGLVLSKPVGTIELRAVAFRYPARRDLEVLKGVDLEVRPGEVVALVGPSGAGKSTIASLVMRLYDPDAGSVFFDGHDVRELDPTFLRRQIGVVSQEPMLFSSTIAENIRYGRETATDDELHAAARAANAHDFIMSFPEGYQTRVGERGVQLSGGQKQRVAIARAVLKDPRVLVLDEATSALDAESEHLVKEALDRLSQGRTTLVIAHRLSTVKDADRVLVMDGGRVVQSGDHASLLAEDGLYRRLVERQFVVA